MKSRLLRTSLLCLPLIASLAHAGSGGVVIDPYAVASAGKGNLSPDIWAKGHPSPGQLNFALTMDKGVGGAPALLVAGSAGTSLPIFGMTLAVDPLKPGFFIPWSGVLSGSAGVAGAGSALAALPLPNIASLVGIQLYAQFVVFDKAASQGLASSRGLRIVINRGSLAVLCGHRNLRTYDYLKKTAVNVGTASSPEDVQFNREGNLLFATGRGTGSNPVFEIYDSTVSPLKKIKTVALGTGIPNHLVVHPDGKRAYVAVINKLGKTSYVHIVDVDPKSKTFGTRLGQVTGIPAGYHFFEGGSISANGRTLAIAEFGFSGAPKLYIIDVDPKSSTRDSVRKIHSLTGLSAMITDVALDESGINAYVCMASFSKSSSFAHVFLPTGKVTKTVTLGSKGLFPVDIDIDPRGRFLIAACANSKNLVLFSLQRGAQFMQPRVFQAATKAQPFSVALTPDAQTAIAATMSHGFWAWDIKTGKILWSSLSRSGGDAIAVR